MINRENKFANGTVLAISLAVLLSIAASGVAQAQDILISGSTTLKPVMTKVVREFLTKSSRLNPRLRSTRVRISGGGTANGVAALSNSQIDIAMMARPLTPGEKGNGLVAYQVAIDGVAIVVNAANPVSEISRLQLIDLMAGRTKNWEDLGGSGEVSVILQANGYATTDQLEKYTGISAFPGDDIAASSLEALANVRNNRAAVTYASLGIAENMVRNNGGLKLLKLEGVEASSATLWDESYPIPCGLFLVTKGQAKDMANDIINYVLSSAGKEILFSFGLLPL